MANHSRRPSALAALAALLLCALPTSALDVLSPSHLAGHYSTPLWNQFVGATSFPAMRGNTSFTSCDEIETVTPALIERVSGTIVFVPLGCSATYAMERLPRLLPAAIVRIQSTLPVETTGIAYNYNLGTEAGTFRNLPIVGGSGQELLAVALAIRDGEEVVVHVSDDDYNPYDAPRQHWTFVVFAHLVPTLWAAATVLQAGWKLRLYVVRKKRLLTPILVLSIELLSAGIRVIFLATNAAFSRSDLRYEVAQMLTTITMTMGVCTTTLVLYTWAGFIQSSKRARATLRRLKLPLLSLNAGLITADLVIGYLRASYAPNIGPLVTATGGLQLLINLAFGAAFTAIGIRVLQRLRRSSKMSTGTSKLVQSRARVLRRMSIYLGLSGVGQIALCGVLVMTTNRVLFLGPGTNIFVWSAMFYTQLFTSSCQVFALVKPRPSTNKVYIMGTIVDATCAPVESQYTHSRVRVVLPER
eukprot:PLAT5609.1.p1 GENE.PLAT5609.1~~PLAT5609.1.p1  ORF type:complete len:472 (+),score=154.78 PLAT5609.1:109-1524(+)